MHGCLGLLPNKMRNNNGYTADFHFHDVNDSVS
jgi:hypothetical protein